MFTIEFLNQAAGWCIIVAIAVFIIAIVQGYRPPKSSWIIWPTVDTIVAFGMYQKHQLNGQMTATVIGAWIVCGFAMKYGISGWSMLQKIYLALTALTVVLWIAFASPLIGIVCGCSLLILGSFDTFGDAWKNPEHHIGFLSRLSWTLFWVSCLFQTAAIQNFTIEEAAQPLTFLFIESVMMFLIFIRPWLNETTG